MSKRKTHKEYVDELAIKNPTVEVIEQYINSFTKILHHCLTHDVYWKICPHNALQGNGCKKCGLEKYREKRLKTHEQYVKEVTEVNPHIEVVERYIDMKTPILHHCTIHNVHWMSLPMNILKGRGCIKCKGEKISDKKVKSHEQYVEELKKINPEILVLGTYINAKTPILHKCLIDGYEWMVIPDSVLHGYGCPQCCESSGERLIRQFLQSHNIPYEYQKLFKDCRDTQPLPFDFYLPNYNVCIEYDGRQHYEPVDCFGGQKSLEYIQKHDKIKEEYCKINNIKLLRIPYYANIEEELSNFLFI